MLGIKTIASYLPDSSVSNYDKKGKFAIDDDFIENKIGVKAHRLKGKGEKPSDMCVKAFEALLKKQEIAVETIDCCVVVTQNPDFNIPHTSAIVHGKLGLSLDCACFDLSLGCSGYVYGMSNILAFMHSNNLRQGLLFTADPYSDIINHEDKNTDLIFGDAATVTYITDGADWFAKDFSFGTKGSSYTDLICKDGELYMNGRAIFGFTATAVPKNINELLCRNNLEVTEIDRYILHQGSKYIVDSIRKRLKIEESKVVFDMYDYGNTVSSSIPIILEKEMQVQKHARMVISGFGVGLSWGSAILEKRINGRG